MISLAPAGSLNIAGQSLEYVFIAGANPAAPMLVLLHEGLGGARMWGDFPERLATTTGASVFAWSRAGYGGSSPVSLPRPLTYMHDEALHMLEPLLDAIGFQRGVLVGHSDGASIAAIYAGARGDARVRGLCLIAPHFFVEDVSIAAIEQARIAYATADLRNKLARWHAHVDVAFRGWNDAWLDPGFRDWDIRAILPGISAPVLVIQGEDDQYGTLLQVDCARELIAGDVGTLVLPGVRHAPYREAGEATVQAISRFVTTVCGDENW